MGITLVTVSATLVLFRLTSPMSTTQVVLALPIAVQEMVLAVWLIAKGFSPVPTLRPELEPTSSRAGLAAIVPGG